MASYDQKFLTGNKARSMLSDVYHEFSLVYAKIDTKADKDHTHLYAGSATVGGPAYYAERLTTATAGATNKPVYFTDGKPAAISYTIDKSVPSNAIFTDYQVTQNNTTSEENYRIIFSANANDSSETSTVRKSTKFLANPSTGVITAPTFKGTLDGNAGSSDKLTTGTTGSANRPVYFKDGVPTLCAYTIGASVPDDAEFTDTWPDIIDNLSSTRTDAALSANQGRVLKGMIDGKSDSGHGHLYAGSATDGGPANSAVKLSSSHTIFGQTFNGTQNVAGQALVYGTHSSDAVRYQNGGLQIRENDNVGTSQTDISYGPTIGFHWGGTTNGTLILHSTGVFYLKAYDGTSRATLDANIIGNVTGNLSGNASSATSATSATNDSTGQKISETYIKALSVNGQDVTYTRGDGSTETITTQDTKYTHPTGAGYNHIPAGGSSNQVLRWKSDGVAEWSDDEGTTYTAGSGISITGTIISNSGVRSITTGSTNGTISVNMNGTTTDVEVKGLGSAAYADDGKYAAYSHEHSYLKSGVDGTTDINTNATTGTFVYKPKIISTAAGIFETSDNANAILHFNRHTGNYDSQLGFSGNGNIYYRYSYGSRTLENSPWKQIAFTDSIASSSSADKLTTSRTIFGHTFDGTQDVAGQAFVYGNQSNDLNSMYANGALLIREKDLVGSGESDFTYAPSIGFHWMGTTACGSLSLASDTIFYLKKQNGSTRATLDANIVGDVTGNATSADKLASNEVIGSSTQPVYFVKGKPSACAYSLEKSVPGNAALTDTMVTNTLNTTTKAYITGTTSSTTNTGTQIFDTGVYLDTTAGMLTATTFKGSLKGTADSATILKYTHTNEINFGGADTTARVYFNYRNTTSDAFSGNKAITEYCFGNRNGGYDGVTLYATNFSGNAASASKLTSGTVGSTSQPVYFKDGVPTVCTLPTASTSQDGLMSSAMVAKINEIEATIGDIETILTTI